MTYSMSKQDLFVMHMLPDKDRQYVYFEIGASHPVHINNTYLLEQNGWKGHSVDIDPSNEYMWKQLRKNELHIMDALTINTLDTDRIDYLSIDIEPPTQTLQCFLNLAFTGCRFSIVTFEHDAYTGSDVREISRSVFESLGYILAVPDVQSPFGSYEDWYIDSQSDVNLELLKSWK
jgi:hypothetical protein